MQRGWSQAELANGIGTKQHVVSPLEDLSYSRYSLQTCSERSTMTKVQNQAQYTQVVVQGDPISVYVEGLSQLMLSFSNSRLMMFNMATRNPKQPDSPTLRNLACELLIPTPALMEICTYRVETSYKGIPRA